MLQRPRLGGNRLVAWPVRDRLCGGIGGHSRGFPRRDPETIDRETTVMSICSSSCMADRSIPHRETIIRGRPHRSQLVAVCRAGRTADALNRASTIYFSSDIEPVNNGCRRRAEWDRSDARAPRPAAQPRCSTQTSTNKRDADPQNEPPGYSAASPLGRDTRVVLSKAVSPPHDETASPLGSLIGQAPGSPPNTRCSRGAKRSRGPAGFPEFA